MGKGTPGSFEILVLSAAVCHHPAWPAVGDGGCQQGVLARLGEASGSAHGAVGSLLLSCPAVSTTFLLPWLPVQPLPGAAVPIADH